MWVRFLLPLPILTLINRGGRGEVVNAPDCDSGTRGFNSPRSPHYLSFFICLDIVFIIVAVVAKWLTHRIVIPAFGGSIPLGRPFDGV